jgi:F0F1-type ATP synthase membrane subunit b/b'
MNRDGLLRAAEGRSQELIRQAEGQAQELVQQAKRHTEHLKNDADAYVSETLHGLKEHLTSIETEVSRTILSIDRGLESIAMQGAEEDAAEEDASYEAYEDEEDDGHELQEEIQPRRASLANDTIGGPTFP